MNGLETDGPSRLAVWALSVQRTCLWCPDADPAPQVAALQPTRRVQRKHFPVSASAYSVKTEGGFYSVMCCFENNNSGWRIFSSHSNLFFLFYFKITFFTSRYVHKTQMSACSGCASDLCARPHAHRPAQDPNRLADFLPLLITPPSLLFFSFLKPHDYIQEI